MRLNYTNKEALHSNNTIPDKNKVNDTDMNSIKNAVNQMSMYTKLSSNNDIWEFSGYEGTLIVGSIIPLEIEASTNPSGNASIKIGDTTYAVKDEDGNSISAVGFEGQYYFVYNGTNLILKSFGVSDYNSLSNQPQINGITLTGDKSSSDLGLASASSVENMGKFSLGEVNTGMKFEVSPGVFKDIYRNVVYFATASAGSKSSGITDCDMLLDMRARGTRTGNTNIEIIIPMVHPSNMTAWGIGLYDFDKTTGDFILNLGTGQAGSGVSDLYVTFEYLK